MSTAVRIVAVCYFGIPLPTQLPRAQRRVFEEVNEEERGWDFERVVCHGPWLAYAIKNTVSFLSPCLFSIEIKGDNLTANTAGLRHRAEIREAAKRGGSSNPVTVLAISIAWCKQQQHDQMREDSDCVHNERECRLDFSDSRVQSQRMLSLGRSQGCVSSAS